jgi:erythrocyte band 7 integral membrane protein
MQKASFQGPNVPEEFSTDLRSETYEGCLRSCGNCQGVLCTWICCCCGSAAYKQVSESQYGIVTEFGKFVKLLPPGLHYLNPMTEKLATYDVRERVIDLSKQSLLTKDNVSITLDAILYFKVTDVYKAAFEVENMQLAIREITRTTLKDVFGHVTLQEAFEQRESISEKIRDILDPITLTWGADVTRVLIQEILLAQDLARGLSSSATAKRTAEGKIIEAQANVDSAKLMREASDVLNTPAAMQIRYLDAITGLAQAQNTKIVFLPSSGGEENLTDIKALKKYLIQTEINQ